MPPRPGFARLRLGGLRCNRSAPGAGGAFRGEPVQAMRGRPAPAEDPSGDVVELFEPVPGR